MDAPKMYRVPTGEMVTEWSCPDCGVRCANATVNLGVDPSPLDYLCIACLRKMILRQSPQAWSSDLPIAPLA